MAWEPYQRVRLAQERKLLAWNMPDFRFHNLLEGTYVEGEWRIIARFRVRLHALAPDGEGGFYLAANDGLYALPAASSDGLKIVFETSDALYTPTAAYEYCCEAIMSSTRSITKPKRSSFFIEDHLVAVTPRNARKP